MKPACGGSIHCGHGGHENGQPVVEPKFLPQSDEPVWSKPERTISRTAFDAALGRELHDVIQETKQMAKQIQKPSDLWALERHLTERRKEIDHKYDFRGSRLVDVLGKALLYENRVTEDNLRGLSEEKLNSVRSFAQFLKDQAA